jgi:hypothetical protein
MWIRASTGCPLAATITLARRGSIRLLVEWAARGAGGGQLLALTTARFAAPDDAARLADVRE